MTRLDAEQMLQQVEQLRPLSPEAAQTLAQWIKLFEYEKIMTLINPAAANGEGS